MVFHWSLSDSKSPHISKTLLSCSFSHLWNFHTSNSSWFFTGVWVTVSVLKSRGLFWVSLLVLIMLLSWSYQFFIWFPIPQLILSSKLFETVSRAQKYNWYHFHSHIPEFVFNSLERSRYLSIFSLSFNFTLCSSGTAKSLSRQVFFFLLINNRSRLLAGIRWYVCISKSRRILCIFV